MKGPLVHRFLGRYQEQYPAVYFWWDEKRQCLWSSILPLAIRQQSDSDIINVSMDGDGDNVDDAHRGDGDTVNVPMTDTATLQSQFDLFTQYLDHANSVCVSVSEIV